MIRRRTVLSLLLAAGLLAPGCAKKPSDYLADDARRKEVIEALVTDGARRQEVIDRLVGPPAERAAVIERILKDDAAAGDLVARILLNDRGRALVAAKVAADPGSKTFIRMLMLTGVMGESLTQKQADVIGLGDAFALGNQKRTMAELKTIGAAIDGYAKGNEGRYPVCSEFGDVSSCLQRKLPADTLAAAHLKDAWGTPIQYRTDPEGTQYILVSYSTDGLYDGLGKVGPTNSFDCDIVYSNGDFIQWPGWLRKNDVR